MRQKTPRTRRGGEKGMRKEGSRGGMKGSRGRESAVCAMDAQRTAVHESLADRDIPKARAAEKVRKRVELSFRSVNAP